MKKRYVFGALLLLAISYTVYNVYVWFNPITYKVRLENGTVVSITIDERYHRGDHMTVNYDSTEKEYYRIHASAPVMVPDFEMPATAQTGVVVDY